MITSKRVGSVGKIKSFNLFECSPVFYPKLQYRQRVRRSNPEKYLEKIPISIKFSALGRDFDFQLETVSNPFTSSSHVLIRK